MLALASHSPGFGSRLLHWGTLGKPPGFPGVHIYLFVGIFTVFLLTDSGVHSGQFKQKENLLRDVRLIG